MIKDSKTNSKDAETS